MAPQVSRDARGRMSSPLESALEREALSLESSDEIESEESISSSSTEESPSSTLSDSESIDAMGFVEQWLCGVWPASPMSTNQAILALIQCFYTMNYDLPAQPSRLLKETIGENEDTDGDGEATEAQVNERNQSSNHGAGTGTRILNEAAAASARENPLVVMTARGSSLNNLPLGSPISMSAVLAAQTASTIPPFAPIGLPALELPTAVLPPLESIDEAALEPPSHPRPIFIRRNAINIDRGLFNLPPPLYTLLPPYESIAAEIEIQRPFREYRAALRRGYEQKLWELRAERDADLANADTGAAERGSIWLIHDPRWSPSIFAPILESGDPFAGLIEEHATLGRFRREVNLRCPDPVRTITERFESRVLGPARRGEPPLNRGQRILCAHLYARRAAEAAEIDAMWDSAMLAHVADEPEWGEEVKERQSRRERESHQRSWMARSLGLEEDEVERRIRRIREAERRRSGRVDAEPRTGTQHRGRMNVRAGETPQHRRLEGENDSEWQADQQPSPSDSSSSSNYFDTPPSAPETTFEPAERGTFAARLRRLVNNLRPHHERSSRRARTHQPRIADTEKFPDFEPTPRYTRTSQQEITSRDSRRQQNHVDALPTYEEVVEEQNTATVLVTVQEVEGDASSQCSHDGTVTCALTQRDDERKSVDPPGVEEIVSTDTSISHREKELANGEVDPGAVEDLFVTGEQTWEWMSARGNGAGEGVEEYATVEYIEHVEEDLGDLYSAD